MAMNSEYRGSASGVAAAKKKAAMKTKTVATPGTKVSQATIDKIKSMGMTAALKKAGAASPEMREGIKRLYGAKRFNAAVSSTKPYNSRPSSSADAARAGAMKPAKPVTKSADAARMGASTVMSKTAAKPVKKSGTTDPFAKAVFSIGKALKGGSSQGMTAAQVAAENKRRIAAAKKNK